jgi:hypothetical protein
MFAALTSRRQQGTGTEQAARSNTLKHVYTDFLKALCTWLGVAIHVRYQENSTLSEANVSIKPASRNGLAAVCGVAHSTLPPFPPSGLKETLNDIVLVV